MASIIEFDILPPKKTSEYFLNSDRVERETIAPIATRQDEIVLSKEEIEFDFNGIKKTEQKELSAEIIEKTEAIPLVKEELERP